MVLRGIVAISESFKDLLLGSDVYSGGLRVEIKERERKGQGEQRSQE